MSVFRERVPDRITWGSEQEEELEERGKLSLSPGRKTQRYMTIAGLGLPTRLGAILMLCAVFLFAAIPAHASTKSHRHRASHAKKSSSRSSRSRGGVPLYKAALLEDADSGRVLMAQNADMEWPPASMAKMMLLLVAQEQINAGRFRADEMVRVSERSAHTGGSRLGLKEGDVYPLRELMKAALVKSANDAAVAVGEKIGGSVEAMVRMMNARAQELGMIHTEYHTVVILGAPSNNQRFAQAGKLMEWGFENYTSIAVLKSGEPLPVHVQVHAGPLIQPIAATDLNVVLPKSDVGAMQVVYDVPPAIDGPVTTGEPLGRVVVHNNGQVMTEVMAISPIAFTAPHTLGGEAYNASAPPEYNPNNQENK